MLFKRAKMWYNYQVDMRFSIYRSERSDSYGNSICYRCKRNDRKDSSSKSADKKT